MNNKRKFKHLTWTDRLIIEKDLKINMTAKQIAEHIGCSVRTIYYEIKRGACTQKQYIRTTYYGDRIYKDIKAYSPNIAEDKYRLELSAKGAPLKLSNDYQLADYIERRIVDDGLTPGAVLGEIKRNKLQFKTEIKSVHTIYNYIDKDVFLRLSLKNFQHYGWYAKKFRTVECGHCKKRKISKKDYARFPFTNGCEQWQPREKEVEKQKQEIKNTLTEMADLINEIVMLLESDISES